MNKGLICHFFPLVNKQTKNMWHTKSYSSKQSTFNKLNDKCQLKCKWKHRIWFNYVLNLRGLSNWNVTEKFFPLQNEQNKIIILHIFTTRKQPSIISNCTAKEQANTMKAFITIIYHFLRFWPIFIIKNRKYRSWHSFVLWYLCLLIIEKCLWTARMYTYSVHLEMEKYFSVIFHEDNPLKVTGTSYSHDQNL